MKHQGIINFEDRLDLLGVAASLHCTSVYKRLERSAARVSQVDDEWFSMGELPGKPIKAAWLTVHYISREAGQRDHSFEKSPCQPNINTANQYQLLRTERG